MEREALKDYYIMKKTILHTIIAALMLFVIGGGVISVLDADWKDTAKKAAMSAAALGTCWYPVSIAAQLAGASAESKIRALINGLILNRSIDYISLSLSQQAFIDTTCPNVANRTAFYTVALIGMSPAFYFVYKLLTKKRKPEPSLPTSWIPTTDPSSSQSIMHRSHLMPKTATLPNQIITPTSPERWQLPVDPNKEEYSIQQEVIPTQIPLKGKEIIEEEELFNRYKEENKLPVDVTWENMTETERVRYLRWKHYIVIKKEAE